MFCVLLCAFTSTYVICVRNCRCVCVCDVSISANSLKAPPPHNNNNEKTQNYNARRTVQNTAPIHVITAHAQCVPALAPHLYILHMLSVQLCSRFGAGLGENALHERASGGGRSFFKWIIYEQEANLSRVLVVPSFSLSLSLCCKSYIHTASSSLNEWKLDTPDWRYAFNVHKMHTLHTFTLHTHTQHTHMRDKMEGLKRCLPILRFMSMPRVLGTCSDRHRDRHRWPTVP